MNFEYTKIKPIKLREIEKDGFRLNPKNATAAKMLKELSEKNKPTSWNYYTPELIPFHEWVKDTAPKRQRYCFGVINECILPTLSLPFISNNDCYHCYSIGYKLYW